MALDPVVFPPAVATELKKNANLGRLKSATAHGDTNGNGVFKELYSYGSRSFSIRDSKGNLVWDSGDLLERKTAEANPLFFNSNHEINKFDDRRDDKGPEGVLFITEENRPNGQPLLVVANEVSGTTTVYEISKVLGGRR